MKRCVLVILVFVTVTCGCVERRITFTSEPPGAIVIVSGKEIGRAPVTIPFTWYGDYEVIYRLKGYQTIKTHARINPPWYEYPPLDLFSHMAPWTYRDNRFFHDTMTRLKSVSDEELIERARVLEEKNRQPDKH